jgi:hypothetical protein
MLRSLAILALVASGCVDALFVGSSMRLQSVLRTSTPQCMAARALELKVKLPPKGTATIRFKPLLEESEAVVVKYKVPFGLNVEQQKGQAICTKDGPGGEKVGDILRFTTQWTLGLPQGDGMVTTVASFGGALSWQ